MLGTLALLGITAGITVVGVLAPKRRYVFGDNALINQPSTLPCKDAVLRIQFAEYRAVANSLLERNSAKGKALNLAYSTFFGAVLVACCTAGAIVVWKLEALGEFPF